MFERFTDRARQSFVEAKRFAKRLRHEYIGVEHVLYGLLKSGGIAQTVLNNANVFAGDVERFMAARLGDGPSYIVYADSLPRTPRCKRVTDAAITYSKEVDQLYVGTEHLLLAMLDEQDSMWLDLLAKVGSKSVKQLQSDIYQLVATVSPNKQRVVYAFGVFDPFSIADYMHLERAAAAGDKLVVAVQGDRAAAEQWGRPPLLTATSRRRLICALPFVDATVNYTDPDQTLGLTYVCPDIFVCNQSYAHEKTLEYCEKNNIRVERMLAEEVSYNVQSPP